MFGAPSIFIPETRSCTLFWRREGETKEKNTRFVELKVCETGKYYLPVLPGNVSCFRHAP
jgi:hypothetical protein